MAHQVFVGIAENVIAFRAVPAEIQRLVFKDGDEVAEPVDHILAAAEFFRIVEIRHAGQFVGSGERRDDFLVDVIANGRLALERHHILETRTLRNLDRGKWLTGVFVTDIFDEQHHQHIVLVLAGIHAAAQFIAARPQGGIKLGFLNCHMFLLLEIQ